MVGWAIRQIRNGRGRKEETMCDDFMEGFKRCLKEHPEEFSELVFEAWCKWFVDTLNREQEWKDLSTGKDRLTLAIEMISGERKNDSIRHEEIREKFKDIIRAMFAPEEKSAFPPSPLGELLERRGRESVV
jgi:hypothetical protein